MDEKDQVGTLAPEEQPRAIEILPDPKNPVEEQLRIMGGAAFHMGVHVLEANNGRLVVGFQIGEGIFVCSSVDEARNIREQLTRCIEIVLEGKGNTAIAPMKSTEAVGTRIEPPEPPAVAGPGSETPQ